MILQGLSEHILGCSIARIFASLQEVVFGVCLDKGGQQVKDLSICKMSLGLPGDLDNIPLTSQVATLNPLSVLFDEYH